MRRPSQQNLKVVSRTSKWPCREEGDGVTPSIKGQRGAESVGSLPSPRLDAGGSVVNRQMWPAMYRAEGTDLVRCGPCPPGARSWGEQAHMQTPNTVR